MTVSWFCCLNEIPVNNSDIMTLAGILPALPTQQNYSVLNMNEQSTYCVWTDNTSRVNYIVYNVDN